MKLKNNILLILLIGLIAFLVSSCDMLNTNKDFRIYSTDKKQCVTVITKGKIRYFINGKHASIPKTNFVKIDISQIDVQKDEIGVCWKNNTYEWEIIHYSSKIIENKLDPLRFKFNTSFIKDENGFPNTEKYHRSNCGTIGLSFRNTSSETVILESFN